MSEDDPLGDLVRYNQEHRPAEDPVEPVAPRDADEAGRPRAGSVWVRKPQISARLPRRVVVNETHLSRVLGAQLHVMVDFFSADPASRIRTQMALQRFEQMYTPERSDRRYP